MLNGIWPTWIYSAIVENHKEIHEKFLPWLDDETNFDRPWTYGNCASSIRNASNDKMPWQEWFNGIEHHINEFLNSLQPSMPYSVHSDEFWVNIYNKGDYQEAHDHSFPGRSLSAIYIMEAPEDNDAGGELVFECPNFNMIKASGMNRIFDQYQYQHIMPSLDAGRLILFPSWTSHYVLPLKSNQRRVSLAANFLIREAENDQTDR